MLNCGPSKLYYNRATFRPPPETSRPKRYSVTPRSQLRNSALYVAHYWHPMQFWALLLEILRRLTFHHRDCWFQSRGKWKAAILPVAGNRNDFEDRWMTNGLYWCIASLFAFVMMVTVLAVLAAFHIENVCTLPRITFPPLDSEVWATTHCVSISQRPSSRRICSIERYTCFTPWRWNLRDQPLWSLTSTTSWLRRGGDDRIMSIK